MSSPLVNAAQCQASSGPQRVALLELYTSEGCSSCPPADRLLSGIAGQGFGPERMVPLAFHVDYWDYIGWTDRFANPAFSARQRDLVRSAGGRTVYTPQFMLNTRDFRVARGDALANGVAEINRKPAGADIKLALKPLANNQLEVAVATTLKASSNAVLYVAVYQNDLSSEVRAGENSGVRLHHDYVVREWRGPIALNANTANAWQQTINFKPDWVAAKMGVAAFVQDQASGDVLQVLRLPMCPV
ncbi:MAG: DUF1223 domain-containing protein [Hydrogenophilales bacterium]|nr:DUF1223 domain-containing protein [Hydrogenophilales bacterium]